MFLDYKTSRNLWIWDTASPETFDTTTQQFANENGHKSYYIDKTATAPWPFFQKRNSEIGATSAGRVESTARR